jgi:hypothetical protein
MYPIVHTNVLITNSRVIVLGTIIVLIWCLKREDVRGDGWIKVIKLYVSQLVILNVGLHGMDM